MGHPFEGWSAINEDWDSGSGVEVSDIMANLKTVARNFVGPVLFTLLIIWGAKALLSLFLGTLMIVAQIGEVQALWTVSSYLGYLTYPVMVLIALVQTSLYRAIQVQAFAGREVVSSIKDVVKLAREVVGKVALTTLIYIFANAVGAVFCLVGALVPFFFFCQGPYLAATTELSPWDSMRRSYELAKAYYMPVLAAIVASLGIGVVLNGCGGVVLGAIGAILSKFSPGVGMLVVSLGGDLFGILGACGLLVISGGLFTTIQSVERSTPFKN